jgi:FkbM family methyltransferase
MLGLRKKNIGSIIDCGANEGQFARTMSRFFPNAKLYCFEPLEAPFNKLATWANTQNGRVHCYNLALGDEEGEVEMHRHDGHTASSSLLNATAHCHQLYPQTSVESTTKVRLATLDHALQGSLAFMPGEVLLKLDVQGFEDRVLRGATKVLAACSSCVLEVCLDPLYEGQADFFELTRLLKAAGYRYAGNLEQVYADDGRVVYLDAVFIRDEKK